MTRLGPTRLGRKECHYTYTEKCLKNSLIARKCCTKPFTVDRQRKLRAGIYNSLSDDEDGQFFI